MAITESTILEQFQEYRKFCFDQISNQNLDKDIKISYMNKIINDLMNQNELLLEMLHEVQQNAIDRSTQMHNLLQKTANKECELSIVLTSVETEVKKFTKQSLECANLSDTLLQITTCVENIEQENAELRQMNQSFFNSLQSQNAELTQYKHLVYSLMNDKSMKSGAVPSERLDSSRLNYLGHVLENKLTDFNDNVTDIVCANLLEEMISSVESTIENEHNNCYQDFPSTVLKTIDSYNKLSNFLDFNHNYELDNSEYNELLKENLSIDCDINFQSRIVDHLSNVCSELSLKTTVIFELKRQLSYIRNEHLKLQNHCFMMGIQLISTLIDLKDELESNFEGSSERQSLLNKLNTELKQAQSSHSGIYPFNECILQPNITS